MHEELGPVDELCVDLLERFGVVGRELDALPKLRGEMCALDGLDVEVEDPGFGVGAHGSVAGVGKGAGLAAAEASDVVFVAAEGLFFGCSGFRLEMVDEVAGEKWESVLDLEGAELLADYLPDNLIRSHDDS